MTVTVETLEYKFEANTTQVMGQMKALDARFAKLEGSVAKSSAAMGASLKNVGKFLTGAVIIAGIRALGDYQTKLDELGSSLKDASTKANVGVESLQRLRFAADQNGSSAGAMDGALAKLNKAIGLTIGGSKKMAEIFDALGLKELVKSGASTEEVFYAVADALKQIKEPAQSDAVAMALMGKTADTLGDILRTGSDGVRALADEFPDAALKSQALVDKLDAMHDSTVKFNQKIEGLASYMEGGFIDAFTKAMDIMTAFAELANGDFANKVIGDQGNTMSDGSTSEGMFDKMTGGGKYADKGPDVGGSDSSAITMGVARRKKAPKVKSGLVANIFDPSAAAANNKAKDVILDLQNLIKAQSQSALQTEIDTRLKAAGSEASKEYKAQVVTLTTSLYQLEETQRTHNAEIEQEAEKWNEAQQARDAYMTGAEAHEAHIQRLGELMKEGKVDAETYNRAVYSFGQIADEAGNALADSLERAVLEGEDLNDVLADLAKSIAKVIFQNMVAKPAGDAFSGIVSSVLSSIASAFGGGIAGGKATGGAVSPGNMYMVGEKGPEPFIPNVPGRIMPNGSDFGGGQKTTIINQWKFEGVNAATVAQLKQEATAIEARVRKSIAPIMIDKQRRSALGGAF